jgi:uncharacterized protein YdeI (YjbR/CyaY-like superfamily)
MELHLTTREEWHKWLEDNHASENEIWLVYYKKASGKPRIKYNDAVEEALCFGWIDGKIKRINEDYFVQRFTPRRPGSRWSKYNIERAEELIKSGKMMPAGKEAYNEALSKPALIYESMHDGIPEIPDDLMNELNGNKRALNNFMKFPESSRRMYLEWLKSAKRPETRVSRIEKIIRFSEENRKPGMI